MVTCSPDLAVDDNAVTGMLTDLGAQLLLVRNGQTDITPVRAAGTFKIWLRGAWSSAIKSASKACWT